MEHWPDLVIVGANHKSAPLALRERLIPYLDGDDVIGAAPALAA